MKKFSLILILLLPLFFFSCKKDTGPYIRIKNIENLIYEAIRDFRVDEGEDGPFVHQYFVVGEAQVLKTSSSNEDEILDELLLLPDGEAILLEDLTQCGVGVESDTEGNIYITVLLAKADS